MLKLVSPQSISTTISEPLYQQYERLKDENWDAQKEWVKEWAEKGYAPAQYLLAKYYDNIEGNSFSISPVEFAIQRFEQEKDAKMPFELDFLSRHSLALKVISPSLSMLESYRAFYSLYDYIKGICYYFGWHDHKQDYVRAYESFLNYLKEDCVLIDGYLWLGFCYYYGQGVSKNYEKAAECFAKGLNERISESVNDEYWHLSTNYKFYVEELKALELMRALNPHSRKYLQHNLGICYYNGQGVNQDYKKARDLFTSAATDGHIHSYSYLGNIYFFGLGTEIDYEKAVEYYTKAIENKSDGLDLVQNNLAVCYYEGLGVDVDREKALNLYLDAAEGGNASAQCNLGHYYYTHAVKQDYKKAIEWYSKAADRGIIAAQERLGFLFYNGIGVEKDEQKALYYFDMVAKSDKANSLCRLGHRYYFGKGFIQNYLEAVKLYQKAAPKGSTDAKNNLGVCYFNGYGVERNYYFVTSKSCIK